MTRLLYLLVISLLIGVAMVSGIVLEASSSGASIDRSQTWPSRTPTKPSSSNSPGATSEPSTNNQTATPTPHPSTGDLPETLPSPLPMESQEETTDSLPNFPTANPCSFPPTATALESAQVHSTPNQQAEIIGQMKLSDNGIIIARYAYQPWWLLRFVGGTEGWVPDQSLEIHGYIGHVPIVASFNFTEGETSIKATWRPTPDPSCHADVRNPQTTVIAPSLQGNLGIIVTLESPSDPSSEISNDSVRVEVGDAQIATPNSLSEVSDVETLSETVGTSAVNWLLVAGITLVAIGIIIIILQWIRGR